MRNYALVLSNITDLELRYICYLYDTLSMICPYRHVTTTQECRSISGQSEAQFYCTTKELLGIVARQFKTHIMNTEISVSFGKLSANLCQVFVDIILMQTSSCLQSQTTVFYVWCCHIRYWGYVY